MYYTNVYMIYKKGHRSNELDLGYVEEEKED